MKLNSCLCWQIDKYKSLNASCQGGRVECWEGKNQIGSTEPKLWLEIYCQLRLSPLCEALLFPPPNIYLCFCLHNIFHMWTVALVVNYILPDAKTYCLVVDAF